MQVNGVEATMPLGGVWLEMDEQQHSKHDNIPFSDIAEVARGHDGIPENCLLVLRISGCSIVSSFHRHWTTGRMKKFSSGS